jgi:hypothetical protein
MGGVDTCRGRTRRRTERLAGASQRDAPPSIMHSDVHPTDGLGARHDP